MKKRPTISDVAALAGVSKTTVSFVLNNTPGHRLSQETVRRVQEAVEQLQYVRSSPAQSLRARQRASGLICVPYATASPRVQAVLYSVTQALQQAGYRVAQMPVWLSTEGVATGGGAALDQYFSQSADGIICLGLAGWGMGPVWSDLIVERRVPFVTVDGQWDRNISSVEIDYFTGACDLAAALIAGGARRLVYLHDQMEQPQTSERLRGLRRAVYEAGEQAELLPLADPLKRDPFLLYQLDGAEYPDSLARLRQALPPLDAQTAVLLDWADHNQFVLRLCQEQGLTIPIAGLEKGTLSPAAFPQVCYSVLPLQELGTAAAEALLQLLDDPTRITHQLLRPALPPMPTDVGNAKSE